MREKSEKKVDQEGRGKEDSPPLEASFSNFIYTLSVQAMVNLGEIPNPLTKKVEKDLKGAKYTIDLLEILREKTRGNLNQEEESLLSNTLHYLRIRYLKSTG